MDTHMYPTSSGSFFSAEGAENWGRGGGIGPENLLAWLARVEYPPCEEPEPDKRATELWEDCEV